MKIERNTVEFQPITIVLETQEDVNLLFNACHIATEVYAENQEYDEEPKLAVTEGENEFATGICEALEPFVTTE